MIPKYPIAQYRGANDGEQGSLAFLMKRYGGQREQPHYPREVHIERSEERSKKDIPKDCDAERGANGRPNPV